MGSHISLLHAFVSAVATFIFLAAILFTFNPIFTALITLINSTPIHPMLNIGGVSWIVPFIWVMILIASIAVGFALAATIFRVQDNEYEYGGGY